MSWQIFLLINLVAASVREFLNKKIANRINPYVSLFYIVLFGQTWLLIFFLLTEGVWPKWDLLTALPGFIFIIGFSAYFSALKISLSQTILFQSYSILVTIILSALFLGEARYLDITKPTGIRIVSGILLAFAALWYLLHIGNKKEEKLERKWFYFILIVICFLGVGSFLTIQSLTNHSPIEVLINQGNVMIPSFLIISLFQRGGNTNREEKYFSYFGQFDLFLNSSSSFLYRFAACTGS